MNEGKRITAQLSEINVTPFVDVMLVLLVIFMVTTPLLEKEIDVALPQAQAKDIEEVPAGVITFKKNKRLYYNNRRINFSDLERFLRETYERKTEKEVYLKADKDLSYGEVIKIMAIIKKAGIENLGMITEPPEGQN